MSRICVLLKVHHRLDVNEGMFSLQIDINDCFGAVLTGGFIRLALLCLHSGTCVVIHLICIEVLVLKIASVAAAAIVYLFYATIP